MKTVMARLLLLPIVLILEINGRDITTSLDTSATTVDASPVPKNTSALDTAVPYSLPHPDSKASENNAVSDIGKRSGINSGWFFDSSSFGYDGFGSTHSTISCPTANDPSTVFTIGTDGTGYPVVVINAEIIQRPLFAQFLVQEVPGPIVVPADAVFDTANRTCPGVALTVYSFLSATRGPCWVVQGYQDPLFTVICQLGDCVGCTSHSYSSSYAGTSTVYKNRCTPQYKSISVWAYCPLIGFPSIVREQVIVPSFCSCLQTPCTKTTTTTGWK